MDLELARQLSVTGDTKILLLVMDGLAGLPYRQTGRAELEPAARRALISVRLRPTTCLPPDKMPPTREVLPSSSCLNPS